MKPTELKPGDKLYRVVEVDRPDDCGYFTWKVEAERVKQVRKDGFAFDRMVGFTTINKLAALGVRFHRTPEAAVQAFIAEQRHKIDLARSAITAAERAIAWADSRTNPTPPPCVQCRKPASFVRMDGDGAVFQCLNERCRRYGRDASVPDHGAP